jgi:hypothetical protein
MDTLWHRERYPELNLVSQSHQLFALSLQRRVKGGYMLVRVYKARKAGMLCVVHKFSRCQTAVIRFSLFLRLFAIRL